tara:strand:- start:1 stop:201 length:201 start_codon:yes stop_codon:yes gene_type:complete
LKLTCRSNARLLSWFQLLSLRAQIIFESVDTIGKRIRDLASGGLGLVQKREKGAGFSSALFLFGLA